MTQHKETLGIVDVEEVARMYLLNAEASLAALGGLGTPVM